MEFIIFTVLAAAILFLSVPAAIRHFQMLQQNSYFFKRYFRWYGGVFGIGSVLRIIVAAAGGFAAAFIVAGHKNVLAVVITAVLILYSVIMAAVSVKQNKKSIKRLVFTARVKRMLAACFVVFLIVTVLSVLLYGGAGKYILGAEFTAMAFPLIPVTVSLLIMKPIEKAISSYYVRDAKKILRSQRDMKIIGVTGSYGKTSTKFILGRILSEKYNTLITPENYNTPMGVVITVRTKMRPQTEVFVCEMGAKRKGDIAEICDIADPDLGIITSIGPQHLDTFGNIETVVSTKFELADRVKKNGGTVYLNSDNTYINAKKGDYRSVTYGTGNADCTAEDITYSPEGLKFKIKKGDTEFSVTSKLLGTHNALNIAAASALALDMGLTPEEITYAVSKLKPIEHRLELKPYINGATLIDDAYNSNPEGCLEAVRVLGSFDGMKKIIVTPGLVELGEREYECNRALGAEAAKYCDVIILVGKKRSVPLADGVRSQNFDESCLYTVSSFKEAMGVFGKLCDGNTVILFENDLPDNYLN